MYTNPISLTGQFRHCGNPFRIDTYMGCNFGCKYCFATFRSYGAKIRKDVADIELIKKMFHTALDTDKKINRIELELLRNRIPLHLGGMSDPFQKDEFELGITYEFLKLSKIYNYPVSISTKTAILPDRYFEVLDPKIHIFQFSKSFVDIEKQRIWERNTPEFKDTLKLIEKLKEKGFWVSIRMQPLIYLEEAKKVLLQSQHLIDFFQVEHLKITKTGKRTVREKLFEKLPGFEAGLYKLRHNYYKLDKISMLKNITELKAISKIPIGCADNEIHEFSDVQNCCGLDIAPESFSNWIKYNTQYIQMTGDKTQWTPKCNISPSNIPSSEWYKCKGCSFKEYVDIYLNKVHKYDDIDLFD